MREESAKLQLKNQVAFLLRGGVILCLLVIACGLALRLGQAGNAELIRALMRGESVSAFSPSGSFREMIRAMNPDSIIALGLAILIALPILRVALISLNFLLEKDWVFFIITLLVLGALFAGPFFHH